MGLFGLFKNEAEKEELLEGLPLSELKYIVSARNIDTTELQTKNDYIEAIIEKGVSKSLIEKYSKVAKMVKCRVTAKMS